MKKENLRLQFKKHEVGERSLYKHCIFLVWWESKSNTLFWDIKMCAMRNSGVSTSDKPSIVASPYLSSTHSHLSSHHFKSPPLPSDRHLQPQIFPLSVGDLLHSCFILKIENIRNFPYLWYQTHDFLFCCSLLAFSIQLLMSLTLSKTFLCDLFRHPISVFP